MKHFIWNQTPKIRVCCVDGAVPALTPGIIPVKLGYKITARSWRNDSDVAS